LESTNNVFTNRNYRLRFKQKPRDASRALSATLWLLVL